MSAYKQFLSSDIILTPFTANKGYSLIGASSLSSSGVDRFIGENITGSIETLGNTTGQLTTQYQVLIYNSIKQLYYSNFLSSSYGDTIERQYIIPGEDRDGDRFVGLTHNPYFYNYPQTTLTYQKYIPTHSGAEIGVVSIPRSLYGEFIHPGSLKLEFEGTYTPIELDAFNLAGYTLPSTTISGAQTLEYNQLTVITGFTYNNGEFTTQQSADISGSLNFRLTSPLPSSEATLSIHTNLQGQLTESYSNGASLVSIPFNATLASGEIIYTTYESNDALTVQSCAITISDNLVDTASSAHVILEDDAEGNLVYGSTIVGNIIYPHGIVTLTSASNFDISSSMVSNNFSCSFSSSLTIFESQYKCTISENEFNMSLNPSLTRNVDDDLIPYDFVTGSDFTPYVTTVGLYNDQQELLAVAKMAQPIPITKDTDTHIIINLDM